MSWDSIIGQERVKNQLTTILDQGRLAHAFLFTGPDGVGKDAMAIELATVVNCERQAHDACGKCASCLQASLFQHPNIHLIFALPTGKGEESDNSPIEKLSNDDIVAIQEQLELKRANRYHDVAVPRANFIKVNSIREIRKQSMLSSLSKGRKVFILLDAENMREESANALLKTLEEPQSNTMLILTTSHPDQLKSTIISRCQVLKFDYLSDEEITTALIERKQIDPTEARSIARMANGSYTRSLELLDTDFLELRKLAVDMLRTMMYRPKEDYFKTIEQVVAKYDKTGIERLLGLMQVWLRDCMSLTNGNEKIVNIDDREALTKFSSVHPKTDYSAVFESIERAVSLVNKNVYIPLILLNLSAEFYQSIIKPNRQSS